MTRTNFTLTFALGLASALLAGCDWGGSGLVDGATDTTDTNVFTTSAFTEQLIQARTFTDGTAVTTVTYLAGDATRRPLGIDFNGDGKIDPVVAYGQTQAVLQILLSQGGPGEVRFASLTLDSKRDMENLADVAVGDIDGDGALDLVGAAEGAVWYFHHPTGAPTTEMALWGNQDQADDLAERIEASAGGLTDSELEALLAQALGPGVNLDDYIVTIKQLYTNVEIGDMDGDSDNDVIASRLFKISLEPRPEVPVEPLVVTDGDVFVFLNPGGAIDGHNWTAISAGRHERQARTDRDGAAGLLLNDLDGDGDLDLVSAARDDNNVQVAWFENPGGPLDPNFFWTQWRIGSVRDAFAIDVADLTGDNRPDVVATGGAQKQLVLFVQPDGGPKRSYDWDAAVIVDFDSYEPRDVKAVDIDNDGVRELVLTGTGGAVRYFEQGLFPTGTWNGVVVANFDPPGEVGLVGYGDLDGDGDLDLVTVIDNSEDNAERVSWIRNELRAFDLSPTN